jgi:hypothetical protein
MARISTYEIDTVVTANDKWIGTDFSGGITKNFTPQVLADFYNESGLLGVVNQINFKYYQTFVGERPIGSITTSTQAPTFSSLTNIKVSEKNSGLKYIVNILESFLNDTVMIADTSDPNKFAIYNIKNIQQDTFDPKFYNLTLEFVEGNGSLQDTHVYGITSLADSASKDKHFVHTQNSSSNSWSITHGLNKYPSVSIIDSGNNIVVGDIEYTSLNTITIRFNASFSGKAYLN